MSKKPETFIATKQIFINGVLHEPGQTVTVYQLDKTELAEEADKLNGDGLVKPADFDASMIQDAPNLGVYAGSRASNEASVQTSVGVMPVSDAEENGVIVEEDVKPRGTAKKSAALD